MLFHIEEDKLTIKLRGPEMFWGLRRQLAVPKNNITNVDWHAEYHTQMPMLRFGGTGLPGALYAGTFRSGDGWRFLYLNRPHGWAVSRNGLVANNVLVLDLQNMRYKQLLLTCPEEMAEQIKLWWTGRKHRQA